MTLLKELVGAPDFTAAVEKLVDPICRRFELPDAYQLGFVVSDVVAADEAMTRDLALEAAFIFDSHTDRWIEGGKESQADARFGFSYHHGFELELIEPRQGAGFYLRGLDSCREPSLHHVGFRVRDLDLQTARLAGQGVPLLVRGRSGSGPVSGDFAYLDTRPEFGIITELVSTRFLGIQVRVPPPRLARHMARRQKSSGKRVLSL